MFNDLNPDIEVRSEAFPWGDAPVKYPAALKAGNPPDFFLHVTTFFETMHGDYDAIIPVDDLVERVGSKYGWTGDYVHKGFYFDNHYWAMPFQAIGQVLYYNQRLLDKYNAPAPLTWDDMLEAGQKCFKPKDGVWGFGLPAAKTYYTGQCIYAYMIGSGGDMWALKDEKMVPAFNTPENVKAFTAYAELLKTAPPGATDWMWADFDLNYATEKVIAGLNWTCTIDAMQKHNAGMIPYTKATVMVDPAGKPTGGLSCPQGGGIFKAAEERGTVEACEKFLEFIMDPKINAYWIHSDPVFVPVTKATGYEPTFEESPIMNDELDAGGTNTWRMFKDTLRMSMEVVTSGYWMALNTNKYPFPRYSGRVVDSMIVCDPIQKMVFENKSAEQALAETDQAMADLLAKPAA